MVSHEKIKYRHKYKPFRLRTSLSTIHCMQTCIRSVQFVLQSSNTSLALYSNWGHEHVSQDIRFQQLQ